MYGTIFFPIKSHSHLLAKEFKSNPTHLCSYFWLYRPATFSNKLKCLITSAHPACSCVPKHNLYLSCKLYIFLHESNNESNDAPMTLVMHTSTLRFAKIRLWMCFKHYRGRFRGRIQSCSFQVSAYNTYIYNAIIHFFDLRCKGYNMLSVCWLWNWVFCLQTPSRQSQFCFLKQRLMRQLKHQGFCLSHLMFAQQNLKRK